MAKVYWQLITSPNCTYISEDELSRISRLIERGFTQGEVFDNEYVVKGDGVENIYFPKKEIVKWV